MDIEELVDALVVELEEVETITEDDEEVVIEVLVADETIEEDAVVMEALVIEVVGVEVEVAVDVGVDELETEDTEEVVTLDGEDLLERAT